MRFTKMHGIGNDYVYINGFDQAVDDPVSLAPKISDRHTGVGGDGLILILPPEPGVEADIRMRMFNIDGSEGEMCGNALRCVAKYAHDHGISQAKPMRAQTGRGILTVDYTTNGGGKLVSATVDMDEPILEPDRIPVRLKEVAPVVNHSTRSLFDFSKIAGASQDWVQSSGLDQRMTCVSMGNPHVVLYCKDVDQIPLEAVGRYIEHHPIFPERINVHFVRVDSPSSATARHWERGSGPTLACGTGACAICVAGVLTGRTDRSITAHLPGGQLELEWRQANNHVYMTGPATEVFSGEWLG